MISVSQYLPPVTFECQFRSIVSDLSDKWTRTVSNIYTYTIYRIRAEAENIPDIFGHWLRMFLRRIFCYSRVNGWLCPAFVWQKKVGRGWQARAKQSTAQQVGISNLPGQINYTIPLQNLTHFHSFHCLKIKSPKKKRTPISIGFTQICPIPRSLRQYYYLPYPSASIIPRVSMSLNPISPLKVSFCKTFCIAVEWGRRKIYRRTHFR